MRFATFFRQLLEDAKLWSFCVALLLLFRLAMIVGLHERLAPGTDLGDIGRAVLTGVRYDTMIAGYVAAVSVLASILSLHCRSFAPARRTRRVAGLTFIVLSAIVFATTIGFFAEYDEQFSPRIFGIYYDDTGAILKTIWEEYHPLAALTGVLAFAAATGVALSGWLSESWGLGEATIARALGSPLRKTLALVLVGVLLGGSVRGSFGRRPAQRKDAAVTADEMLNKLVMNPYTCLRYAVKDHLRLRSADGLEVYLRDGDVRTALHLVTGKPADTGGVDDALERTARGPAGPAPKHVFLIVAESYEAWPMWPEYAPIGLAPELSRLARDGTWLRAFVPASGGTMESFVSVITGLPETGIHTNYRPTAATAYPTSLPATFRRLGYATRMFYGGYLSWQSVDRFARDQGFDEVYGGGHAAPEETGNEWGVDDEDLFSFVTRTVTDDTPSFNVILTTTFHPPYDIDLAAKGVALPEVPAPILARCAEPPDAEILGHFRYADRCLGRFVSEIEPGLTRPLFAITGDHAGRRVITARPSLAEKSLVPFVLYGPSVLAGRAFPPAAAGSHIDIGPTLVELCAPAGTPYHALGRDLLGDPRATTGVGNRFAVTASAICEVNVTGSAEPLPWSPASAPPPDVPAMLSLHGAVHGIGWWRVLIGPDLPPTLAVPDQARLQ